MKRRREEKESKEESPTKQRKKEDLKVYISQQLNIPGGFWFPTRLRVSPPIGQRSGDEPDCFSFHKGPSVSLCKASRARAESQLASLERERRLLRQEVLTNPNMPRDHWTIVFEYLDHCPTLQDALRGQSFTLLVHEAPNVGCCAWDISDAEDPQECVLDAECLCVAVGFSCRWEAISLICE